MPTLVLPVKLTMSTSRDSTSAAPSAGFEPVTTLTTPGGNPTSSQMRASSITASGSCGAGFMTTALPTASAGATLPAMATSGKLYGEMQATTPTGGRSAIAPINPPGASGVDSISIGARATLMSWVAPRA
jgi:hypothetical protein